MSVIRIRRGGRPRVANPVKGRTRAAYNLYMRDYMRGYRARHGARSRCDLWMRTAEAPLYDPRRDGPLHHASLSALLCGDPPIGRSALDQMQSAP